MQTDLTKIKIDDIRCIDVFCGDKVVYQHLDIRDKILVRSPPCFSINSKCSEYDFIERNPTAYDIRFSFYSSLPRWFHIQECHSEMLIHLGNLPTVYTYIFFVREDFYKEKLAMPNAGTEININGNQNIINNQASNIENTIAVNQTDLEELSGLIIQLQKVQDESLRSQAVQIVETMRKEDKKNWKDYLKKLLELGGTVVSIVLPFYEKYIGA